MEPFGADVDVHQRLQVCVGCGHRDTLRSSVLIPPGGLGARDGGQERAEHAALGWFLLGALGIGLSRRLPRMGVKREEPGTATAVQTRLCGGIAVSIKMFFYFSHLRPAFM